MNTERRNPLLQPGKNCWRVDKAEKASFLIDGDAYFRVVREAIKLARHSVFIMGWDIDSRMKLVQEDPDDGYPSSLRDFLDAVAREKKDLQIYILIWDFAMLIGMNREWFPIYRLDWRTHPNIRLAMDDLHPVGASHHQKLVIIDDTLAFGGGLDLTKRRWDTTLHDPAEEKRITPDGKSYRPHHDVQVMVAGECAAVLGDYFRQRWRTVSSRPVPGPKKRQPEDVWPTTIEPDLSNCKAGIARTRAKYQDDSEVREVETLYLDTVRWAREYIYIENQYLTAPKISRAIAESLQSPEGPEIIIVLPLATDGWLSQYTMDVLRQRAVREMQEADKHNRLGVFYAHQEGLSEEDSIKVHAKLMIADDVLARIGSSNLNNRSMGLDTEIDLALEATSESEPQEAVARFCNRLMAEHLGVDTGEIEKVLAETGSRLEVIRRLQGNKRTLKPLEVHLDETVKLVSEEQYLLDPEEPIEPERLIDQWLPLEKLDGHGFNKIGLVLLILAGIGLAAAWRFTPLHDMISGDKLFSLVDFLKNHELAWLYVSAAYVFGAVLIVPITLLITLTVLLYGSVKGFVFAIIGSAVSGAITYWLGRIMGRKTVRKLAGDRVNRVSQRLGKSGIVSTLVVRLMPIAPYSIVNIVAGATHIRFKDFMLGTVLGMLPGTLAIAGLLDRGMALFTNPGPLTLLSLIAVGAAVAAAYFFMQKKLQEKN